MSAGPAHDYVIVGQVKGLFGVKGWVKVFSQTVPRDNILSYNPWYLRAADTWQRCKLEHGQAHGGGIIAKLDGVEDRSAAAPWVGAEIAIAPTQLAPLPEGEYYWSDLIGLKALNLEGYELGYVTRLIETGAHDVLVISGDKERLIPFVRDQVIKQVDVPARTIHVDWEPDF